MSVPDLAERYHRARRDPSLAVLEGLHALKHALRFGAEILDARAPEPERVLALAAELAPDLLAPDPLPPGRRVPLSTLLRPVSHEGFARLAPRPHPTGVIALARRPPFSLPALLGQPGPGPVVLLEEPARLGNVGAVVRVAAAAGAGGILTTGRHDPWNPEALRGGAGLHFAMPVAGIAELPQDLAGRPLLAIHPEGPALAPAGIPPRAILAFGTERHGLSPQLLARADERVSIPMREGVSSLNLATAVAVALYAWRWADPPAR